MLAMQRVVDSYATAQSSSSELAVPQLLAFHSSTAGHGQLFVHDNLCFMAAAVRRWCVHLPAYIGALVLN